MRDRLDDGIRLLEHLIQHYQEVQSLRTKQKNYDEAKRVHLMSRGVKHSLQALKKLKNGQVEIV